MIVGLTGGVATGKSLVARELERLGARLIDCDRIAREVVRPDMPAYLDILREFGKGVLNPDSTINRSALGSIVFSDPERLKKLNSITHPRILLEVDRIVEEIKKREKDPVIVIDAALLIEVGLHKGLDKVIVVYAKEERQIERIRKRDALTGEEARSRVMAQMPIEEKRAFADFLIDNNGTIEETLKNVREVYEELTGRRGRR